MLDETTVSSQISLKAMGHQWYWSYEYRDEWSTPFGVSYDSYILSFSDLSINDTRLLEVDNRTPLPLNTVVRAMVSSRDVLHS